MSACDVLDLCPQVAADPSNPDIILFWDTDDPETVVRIQRDSWVKHVDDVKAGVYDNV